MERVYAQRNKQTRFTNNKEIHFINITINGMQFSISKENPSGLKLSLVLSLSDLSET